MYSSVITLIARKIYALQRYISEMNSGIKLITTFKDDLADRMPERNDFAEAMKFYKTIKYKYKIMPNRWLVYGR